MRRSTKRQRIFIWVLSLVIVASMICSFLASMQPRSTGSMGSGASVAAISVAIEVQ